MKRTLFLCLDQASNIVPIINDPDNDIKMEDVDKSTIKSVDLSVITVGGFLTIKRRRRTLSRLEALPTEIFYMIMDSLWYHSVENKCGIVGLSEASKCLRNVTLEFMRSTVTFNHWWKQAFALDPPPVFIKRLGFPTLEWYKHYLFTGKMFLYTIESIDIMRQTMIDVVAACQKRTINPESTGPARAILTRLYNAYSDQHIEKFKEIELSNAERGIRHTIYRQYADSLTIQTWEIINRGLVKVVPCNAMLYQKQLVHDARKEIQFRTEDIPTDIQVVLNQGAFKRPSYLADFPPIIQFQPPIFSERSEIGMIQLRCTYIDKSFWNAVDSRIINWSNLYDVTIEPEHLSGVKIGARTFLLKYDRDTPGTKFIDLVFLNVHRAVIIQNNTTTANTVIRSLHLQWLEASEYNTRSLGDEPCAKTRKLVFNNVMMTADALDSIATMIHLNHRRMLKTMLPRRRDNLRGELMDFNVPFEIRPYVSDDRILDSIIIGPETTARELTKIIEKMRSPNQS